MIESAKKATNFLFGAFLIVCVVVMVVFAVVLLAAFILVAIVPLCLVMVPYILVGRTKEVGRENSANFKNSQVKRNLTVMSFKEPKDGDGSHVH